jgi:hypothetical protein
MKWNGIKNGELIRMLGENKFDCWIIADKNLPYQQNTETLTFVIIVLDVFRNTLRHITALMPLLLSTLQNLQANKIIVISENG